MRSRNKVVDGEPVAEQKMSLVSNIGIFMTRVRKEKERLTAVKKQLHTPLNIWNRWIEFGSGTFKIWKLEDGIVIKRQVVLDTESMSVL